MRFLPAAAVDSFRITSRIGMRAADLLHEPASIHALDFGAIRSIRLMWQLWCGYSSVVVRA